jgi:hypothetical protein
MDHVLNERPAEAGRNEISAVDPILFALFFLSGFCSLLYQVVWVRMAFTHFGVITPVLSVALSVFMAGLGIGSVLGGRCAEWSNRRLGISSAYLYGRAEFIIGIGAFLVAAVRGGLPAQGRRGQFGRLSVLIGNFHCRRHDALVHHDGCDASPDDFIYPTERPVQANRI